MPHPLVLLAAAVLPARAGEIFGDVRQGTSYVAEAPVQLTCGADTVRGKTAADGSFRLATRSAGKCVFTITHQKTTVSVDVIVFDKPARYRLMLEQKDGAWILRRV